MPTKLLPLRPNIEHLKHQAKDLLKGREGGEGTPLKWAEYAGRAEVAEYLRGLRG
jgi:hypothetical protein